MHPPPGADTIPAMNKRAELTRQALPSLVGRIERFLVDNKAERFDDLALEAFAFAWRNITPYRRLAQRRNLAPGLLSSWREAPAVPTTAFQTLRLEAHPAQEIFRSSGTTGGPRSVHYHPFPELYRKVIDASFPTYCLPAGERQPILSLIPSRQQVGDSSLSFMADHLLHRFGTEDNAVAFGPDGVQMERARAWCDARSRDGQPGLILATAFALVQWLDALEASGTTLALPAGSTLFETGGFKGRSRELSRRELLAATGRRLGLGPERVVREYGMSELTSQLYSRSLLGGDRELLVAPHWVRVRILDPLTLQEIRAGETGIIAIFDLANLGSAPHLMTQDLGRMEAAGLRLLGRAEGAELRGCSLTAEEFAHAAGPDLPTGSPERRKR